MATKLGAVSTQTLDQFSSATPALASHGGRLFLGWVGSGNDELNAGQIDILASTGGMFWLDGVSNPATVGQASSTAPALASHEGRLFYAWKGSGNDQLNLMFSEDGGHTFKGAHTFSDATDAPPSLASHQGRLILAWKGSGNDELNIAKIDFVANTTGGFDIAGLSDHRVLGEASGTGPALASHSGRLFYAWKGSGNDQLNLMFSEDGGNSFKGKQEFLEFTDAPPTLASHNGQLFLGWKGSGNPSLNVAKVEFLALSGVLLIAGLDKSVLALSSFSGPGLVSHNGLLLLAFRGPAQDRLVATVIVRASCQVQNESISLTFDLNSDPDNLGQCFTLERILDRVTKHQFLKNGTSLFEFAANNGIPHQSNRGVAIQRFAEAGSIDPTTEPGENSRLVVEFFATPVPGELKAAELAFTLTVFAPPGEPAAILWLTVTSTGKEVLFLRLVLPKLFGITTPGDPHGAFGAIPQEIGSVGPLRGGPPMGRLFDIGVGLPHAMNSMEVADVYDPTGGGGVFFADIEGDLDHSVPPLQFNLSDVEVDGFWIATLAPGQTVKVPGLAIGVHHEGDWHEAVSYYCSKHSSDISWTSIPEWFRDQGAIYSFSSGGAGGIYLEINVPPTPLYDRLLSYNDKPSFCDLPCLLEEGLNLGTNILYLFDYWEGTSEGGLAPYFNKGDYTPRSDLGGECALIEGIKRVHAHDPPGRVILYVESFIIYFFSQIGHKLGPAWAGLDPNGNQYQQYKDNYSMVAPFADWRNWLSFICDRLVGFYKADGIFLDSCAWQMNWPMQAGPSGPFYLPDQYSRGVFQMVDLLRNQIQALNPEAVVIGETTGGPIARHWHGGLSADFAEFGDNHLRDVNRGRIIASPVRFGFPQVNFISNGTNISELNQIFAAGHSLALCGNYKAFADPNGVWPESWIAASQDYIRSLVQIRQNFRDALIYGQQSYQPATGDPSVAAYFYHGTLSRIITIVNTSQSDYAGTVSLATNETNSSWDDLLSGEKFVADSQARIAGVTLPPGGLRVLSAHRFQPRPIERHP
jgi:hypothetical protein